MAAEERGGQGENGGMGEPHSAGESLRRGNVPVPSPFPEGGMQNELSVF